MLAVYITLLLYITQGYALKSNLWLYEDVLFNKLLFEDNVEGEECFDLPKYIKNAARSARTRSCVLLYVGAECQGSSLQIDEHRNGGEYNLYKETSIIGNFGSRVQSYRKCMEHEVTDNLKVDFYTVPDNDDVTFSYSNVCKCMELPTLTSNFETIEKIYNYGSCVALHTEKECKGESHNIAAGLTKVSGLVGSGTPAFQSISPCGNYTSLCLTLIMTVTNFNLPTQNKQSTMADATRSLSMATLSKFNNNGSATVTQQYAVKQLISESFETIRNSFTLSRYTVDVSAEAKLTLSTDIPVIQNVIPNLEASLHSAYTYENIESVNETQKYSFTKETEFSVSQTISIAPCTEYEVSSHVNILNDFEIQYTTTYDVVAFYDDGKPVNEKEIEQHLNGFKIISSQNNKVVASYNSTAILNFVAETVVDASGKKTAGCHNF